MLLRLGRHYPGNKTWGARRMAAGSPVRSSSHPRAAPVHRGDDAGGAAGAGAHRTAGAGDPRGRAGLVACAGGVTALQAMRGIDLVSAVTMLAEIGDLSRFASPRQLMAYLGLVPSERSTGESVKRGPITKAGNWRARRMLVEAAWSLSASAARRAREAEHRSMRHRCGSRDRLESAGPAVQAVPHAVAQEGKRSTVVVTAIARELAAFIWAINREVSGQIKTAETSRRA